MTALWTPADGLPKHGTVDGPYLYDENRAAQSVAWYAKYLRIPDEARAFTLEPWQSNYISALDGWITAPVSTSIDGPTTRGRVAHRFTKGHIEIARGNGKSTFGAGRGIKGLIGDGRLAPFVLGAGTDVDNAGIIFSAAASMARDDKRLKKRLAVVDSRRRILRKKAKGLYRIIGAEAKHAHGYHPSLLIVDDLQAQPSAEFIRVLHSAQATIDDPLMLSFMTAGYDESTIGFEEHSHALRVVNDAALDENLLVAIYAADKDDDFESPAVWRKANPNLGVTVSESFIRSRVREMMARPSTRPEILRLHFNIWTEAQFSAWMPSDVWTASAGAVTPSLRERACFVGVSATSAIDVACVAYVFPPVDGDGWRVKMDAFVPAGSVDRLEVRDGVSYQSWLREGWMVATDGDTRDDAAIVASVVRRAAEYEVRQVAVNPRGSAGMMTVLDGEGLEVIAVLPAFAAMSPAMTALEHMALSRSFAHGGDRFLAWQMGNVQARKNSDGDLKIDAEKSSGPVAGPTALCMALSRALMIVEEEVQWAAS